MPNFSNIASRYENDSIVQKSASEILFDLLEIQSNDNVLDLGCGTGHITKLIREKTNGMVVGIDPAEGMISKAKEKMEHHNIIFKTGTAEQLDYVNEFDIIFCNSTFQWFTNPKQALRACLRSLRNRGKMAIQAPARDDYCPNFLKAMEKIKQNKATKNIFAEFHSPWFFRNTAAEYKKLFEDAGFQVNKSTIDKVVTRHTADEVFKIFESGAAAGYLNQDYYSVPLSPDYTNSFRDIVRKSFIGEAGQADRVELIFYRIYLLAVKKQ